MLHLMNLSQLLSIYFINIRLLIDAIFPKAIQPFAWGGWLKMIGVDHRANVNKNYASLSNLGLFDMTLFDEYNGTICVGIVLYTCC